jgi:hypothetical protein
MERGAWAKPGNVLELTFPNRVYPFSLAYLG